MDGGEYDGVRIFWRLVGRDVEFRGLVGDGRSGRGFRDFWILCLALLTFWKAFGVCRKYTDTLIEKGKM